MFALAYIVLNENLQAKVFGTSVGIIAAINGGVGGVDGYVGGLMAETLGFRSIFVVVLVLTAIAAVCIFRLVPAGWPAGARASDGRVGLNTPRLAGTGENLLEGADELDANAGKCFRDEAFDAAARPDEAVPLEEHEGFGDPWCG